MKRILSLGAGVQSSTLLLMSCKGVLPKLDCAVFADTQYEPRAVYDHLAWLEAEAAKAGIPVHRVTAGNLKEDALAWLRSRKSVDGKRFASLPLFVENADGSQGRIRRQCTKVYKIEPVERFILREVLGLRPRQRRPREPVVEQWLGISSDEPQRAKGPGVMVNKKRVRKTLTGDEGYTVKVWRGELWKTHAFPLLNLTIHPDRRSSQTAFLPAELDRAACLAWLRDHYPDRAVPRSACINCPNRSNAEWRDMRDNDPEAWADAVQFDRDGRRHPAAGLAEKAASGGKLKNPLAGVVYVHRQMVPLDMADLDGGPDQKGGGCGTLFDEIDGMCGT